MKRPNPQAMILTLLLAASAASGQGSSPIHSHAGADADSIRFGSVQLATGLRMHFAERGDPSGEPVILLHGYSDSWFSFSRVMPLLPTRYHLYALDQRGHGRSQQPEGGYTMPGLAADVLAFMDARGIARATIVGHSMGGFVAQQIALASPKRVARLVLVASGTGVRHLPGEFRASVLALRDPVPVEFVREFQLSTINRPVPDEFLAEVIRESQRLPARVWHSLIEGMYAMPPATGLATLAIPTLLVHGEKDAVFPPAQLEALKATHPRATALVYPEIGHALHWESPERFARDLEAFLDGRTAATAPPAQHHHGQAGNAAGSARVPLYTNLGSHHYAITTRNPRAQQYFDQGLRLTWAFNHPEAIRSFAEGERIDSTCGMCAWGIAFALGPNINAGMDSTAGVEAARAIQRAQRRASHVSARERALIEALAARYAPVSPADRARLDSAWAYRIGAIADRFRDDQEAQVLHADALMNLSPWNYWNRDGSRRPGTEIVLRRLERVLAANPNHPGACHLFIHAVEAPDPARALPCAERLPSLMPGAGHIVHMPGHIYIRVGRYEDAIRLNQHAAHADGELLEGPGVARRGVYANGYYPHNYHFLSFAASMAGRSQTAIDAARETAKRLGVEAVKAVPWVESVTPIVQVTLVTFGRWKEILAEPEPSDSLPFLAAMTWYARGVAHAALGDEQAALRDLQRLRDRAASFPANDNGTALRIAVHALQGEIALRSKRAAEAVEHFREATRLEDGLTYNEPPTWYYPMRQSLGLALLAADRPKEAERAYREDLERFPRNGWSLFGLSQSLERQARTDEARRVRAQFAEAWKLADVQLAGSRM